MTERLEERRRPTWLVALVLAAACWVVAVVAYAALQALIVPDGCYQSPDESAMRWARAILAALSLGVLVPWVVAFLRRDEWWLLPVGLLASGPAVLGALVASTTTWSRVC